MPEKGEMGPIMKKMLALKGAVTRVQAFAIKDKPAKAEAILKEHAHNTCSCFCYSHYFLKECSAKLVIGKVCCCEDGQCCNAGIYDKDLGCCDAVVLKQCAGARIACPPKRSIGCGCCGVYVVSQTDAREGQLAECEADMAYAPLPQQMM
mmetsp:Transcript_65178/g.119969  ORF Transcript_65178/g.119969 Transcript_65178/m.119969 type:complete len:150 (-) Transcript_65178:117-566(-)